MIITATDRRDALYDELLYNCGGEWIKMDILFSLLSEYYPPLREGQNVNNSRARRLMTEDIAIINATPGYKVIVTGIKGVKIATEEEAERAFASRKAAISRDWRSLRELGRKIGLDGQIDLDGDVIEAFAGE